MKPAAICPYCGKSYTQQTYLQKHMTKHAERQHQKATQQQQQQQQHRYYIEPDSQAQECTPAAGLLGRELVLPEL